MKTADPSKLVSLADFVSENGNILKAKQSGKTILTLLGRKQRSATGYKFCRATAAFAE